VGLKSNPCVSRWKGLREKTLDVRSRSYGLNWWLHRLHTKLGCTLGCTGYVSGHLTSGYLRTAVNITVRNNLLIMDAVHDAMCRFFICQMSMVRIGSVLIRIWQSTDAHADVRSRQFVQNVALSLSRAVWPCLVQKNLQNFFRFLVTLNL